MPLGPLYFDETDKVIRAIESSSLTALVVATQQAALELLDAASAGSPLRRLAIATFDNDQIDERSGMLTTMRLPWEDVGTLAADLLADGSAGAEHLIPMQLIPRLSSLRPPMPADLAELTA